MANAADIMSTGARLYEAVASLDYPEEIRRALAGKPLGHLAVECRLSEIVEFDDRHADAETWLVVEPRHRPMELRGDFAMPLSYDEYQLWRSHALNPEDRFYAAAYEEHGQYVVPTDALALSFRRSLPTPEGDIEQRCSIDVTTTEVEAEHADAVLGFDRQIMDVISWAHDGLRPVGYDASAHRLTFGVVDGWEANLGFIIKDSPYLPLNMWDDLRFLRRYRNHMTHEADKAADEHRFHEIANRELGGVFDIHDMKVLSYQAQLYRDAAERASRLIGSTG